MFTTVASSLIVALLFAFVFRVPIPLGGMLGPFGEISSYEMSIFQVVKMVVFSWSFYGMFGGYIFLASMGAGIGALIGKRYSMSDKKDKLILIYSFVVGAIPVIFVSILDFIIGPW